MSFSFDIRARTKAEAKSQVAAKLDQVVFEQPQHATDRSAVAAAAFAHIDLVDEDETRDVRVIVSGSISGRWSGAQVAGLSSAAVSVQVYLADR